jgi:hypothetical protein
MRVRAAVAAWVVAIVLVTLGGAAQAADPPIIISLNPSSYIAGAGAFSLTVNGANFVSGAVVRVNGVSRTTTFVDSGHVRAAITAADVQNAGNIDITATNPGTAQSSKATLTIFPNDPQISSLNPTSASVGGPSFILQVNGTNFASTGIVRVNGVNRSTTYVSNVQLNATIPATDINHATTLAVTVLNPNQQISPSVSFNVTSGPAAPSISVLSPNPVSVATTPVTLNVSGANFISGAVVRADGLSRQTTFVDSSHLTAQLFTSDVSTPKTVSITVTNPGSSASSPATLNVVAANIPSIASLSPTSVIAGSPQFTLTVNGNNFVNGATTKVGSNNRTTTFVSVQQLKVTVPASDVVAVGSRSVVVTNPAPSGGASSNAATFFVVSSQAPVLTSLNPSSIAAGSDAFKLTINGSGFLIDDFVQVDGTVRTTEFVNANQLIASLTAADVASEGTVPISVSRKDGKAVSAPLNLTVGNASGPLITSLSPAVAFAGGEAFILTVNGQGFDSAAVVSLDNTPRTTQFVSPNRLTIQVNASDLSFARDIPVVVTNPGGATSAVFTLPVVLLVPTIDSLSPSTVSAGDPSLTVTLTGSNFSSSAVVNVNGVAHPTTFLSSSSLSATISEADISAGGTLLLTVTDNGATSAAVPLTVRQPAITSIQPGVLPFGTSAATLIVAGTGFSSRSIVVFKGVDRPTVFDASTGILIATLGASDLATPGSFAVVVRNSINAISAPFVVQVVAPGTPVISGLDPGTIAAGSAAPLLRVLGVNFVELSTVQVNGTPRTTTFVNSAELDVTLLQSDVTSAGSLSIVVVNPDGTSSSASLLPVTGPVVVPPRRRAGPK